MNTGKTIFSRTIPASLRIPINASNVIKAITRREVFHVWINFCHGLRAPTYRQSLRDIESCHDSCDRNFITLGFRVQYPKAPLADANNQHWHIYADRPSVNSSRQEIISPRTLRRRIKQAAYALMLPR